MSSKNEALEKIVEIARSHNISASEISDAMQHPVSVVAEKNKIGITTKLFSYLGSIFILSGISVYINMVWSSLNSPSRVIITLGSGLLFYMVALVFEKHVGYRKMITPLFLLAALFIPTGLFVTLHEYSSGNNWHLASMLVFGVVFLQQFITFLKTHRTVLVFTSLFFAAAFYVVTLDYMSLSFRLIDVTLGLSLMCFAYGLHKTKHHVLTPLLYLVGSILFLFGAFDFLQNTRIELLYLFIACFMIYLSAYNQSRTLLFVSTCALLSYISYFTSLHFVNSFGWPLTLVLLGCVFFGVGIGVLRVHRRFRR